MLVLSRKVGERVMIGSEVVVEVLEVNGSKVRLGFEAPPYVPIAREELLTESAKQPQHPARQLAHSCR